VIQQAFRGDVDMRRYAPEVQILCAKLDISEPPWFDEEEVRERLGLDRPELDNSAEPR
jgi:hypothetical protein